MSSNHPKTSIESSIGASQNPYIASTVLNNPYVPFMGKTVLNTIIQESKAPNQPINSSIQRQRSNSFNQNQTVNANENSQIKKNEENNLSNTGKRISNTPNRISNVETSKNVTKTQISPSAGNSNFFKQTIVKDGKAISNIDLNDDIESMNSSHSGLKLENNINAFNNPTVQSFQIPDKGTIQAQNQNLPSLSQKIKPQTSLNSNANQSIHPKHQSINNQSIQNIQKQSQQPNLQSNNQSLNNVNLQSQSTPVQSVQSNLQSQKLPIKSVQSNLQTQSLPAQFAQSNPQSKKAPVKSSHQSQKQSINNSNLQSQNKPIQSVNPSGNFQKQSIKNPNQSTQIHNQSIHSQNQSQSQQIQIIHPKNQNMSQQNQNIHPQNKSIHQSEPRDNPRKSNKEHQQNSSQTSNNPINESNKLSGSNLLRKSSLKASRNKSPPKVIRTSDGKIKRTELDNSGNSYYVTVNEEKIVSDSYISSHLNEYLSNEIEITKSKAVNPQRNIKGNGFRYFCPLTKAGRNQDGKTKTNQDTPLSKLNVGDIPGFNMFGVLDGHGQHGHFVSKFCMEYFIKRMMKYAEYCKQNKLMTAESIYNELKRNKFGYIKETFRKVDEEMAKQAIFDYNFSGTTCNIAFQFNKNLVCASVGDSRGIIIEEEGDSKIHIISLSTDHKPDLPGEMNRIHLNGGIVDKMKDYNGNKVGPPRVWKAGTYYPGLAMSRSLGDFQAKECGVINSPQIVEYNIRHNTKFMTICSDGVWEFIQNEQVARLGIEFYKKHDVGGFCTDLIKTAMHSWEQFDIIRDDITVVCVYF